MDLSKFQNIVRRYLWVFVLVPLVTSLTTVFVVSNEPPSYRATTRLLVGPSLESPSPDLNSLRIGGQLLQTYAEMAQTRSFLESVNNKLEQKTDISSLNRMITTRQNTETRILTIIAYHPDPKQAVAIARAAAETFVEISPAQDNITASLRARMNDQAQQLEKIVNKSERTIKKLETELDKLKSAKVQRSSNLQRQNLITRQLADERSHWADALRSLAPIYQMLLDTNTNQLEIIEPAGAAFPVNQDLPLKTAASGIAGLILAVIIAFVFEYLDDTIRNPQSFSRSVQVPLLSKIEKHNRLEGAGLERVVAFAQPQSRATNSYRTAVSKLLLSIGKSIPYTFLLNSVGSSHSGDDTATATVNLAVAFARAGNRVVVVDAQLHNPVLTNLFQADNRAGLSDLLITNSTGPQLIPAEEIPGLRFLPAGISSEEGLAAALNPAKIFKLIEELQREADIVLIAGSPISWSAESLTLASQVKSVILVTRQGEARLKIVNEVIENLMGMNVQIAGIIFDDNPSPFMSKPRRKSVLVRRDKKAVQVDLDTTQPPAVAVLPADENMELAHLEQIDIEVTQPADVTAVPADEKIEAIQLDQEDIEAPQPIDVAALPADEKLQPTRLDQVDIDAIQAPEMGNLPVPTDEIEVSNLVTVDADPVPSPNLTDSITSVDDLTSLEEVTVDLTQTQDLEPAVMPTDENTELRARSQVEIGITSLEEVAVASTQTEDLEPAAMPTDEMASLEEVVIDPTPALDLEHSITPADEIAELLNLGQVDVDLTSLQEVAINRTQTQELEVAAMPADENTELPTLGQVGPDTIQSPDLAGAAESFDENLELLRLDRVEVDSAQSPNLRNSAMLSQENLELAPLDTNGKKAKANHSKNSNGSRRANRRKSNGRS